MPRRGVWIPYGERAALIVAARGPEPQPIFATAQASFYVGGRTNILGLVGVPGWVVHDAGPYLIGGSTSGWSGATTSIGGGGLATWGGDGCAMKYNRAPARASARASVQATPPRVQEHGCRAATGTGDLHVGHSIGRDQPKGAGKLFLQRGQVKTDMGTALDSMFGRKVIRRSGVFI
jgi:hypothetical protein